MLQMTCDIFGHLLVPYLCLCYFKLFFFFISYICMSTCSHSSCYDTFILYLQSVFKSVISILIILPISLVFMLALGCHLAIWYASVSISTFISFLICFLILIFCDHFISCQFILWIFIKFYDHLLGFQFLGI